MNKQIKSLLVKYDRELLQADVPVMEVEDEVGRWAESWPDSQSHARWMINHMLDNPEIFEGNIGKTNRWLGFIQSVLWYQGFTGILALREETTGVDDEPF